MGRSIAVALEGRAPGAIGRGAQIDSHARAGGSDAAVSGTALLIRLPDYTLNLPMDIDHQAHQNIPVHINNIGMMRALASRNPVVAEVRQESLRCDAFVILVGTYGNV
jgi:hypothetical protein